jgi:hypothetical protein
MKFRNFRVIYLLTTISRECIKIKKVSARKYGKAGITPRRLTVIGFLALT